LAHGAATDPQLRAEQDLFAFSPTALVTSERPTVRPAEIEQAAQQRAAAIRRGQVCGDPAIQGEAIGRVNGNGRCGIENAVRVRAVAGVTLQPAATIDCATASALKRWVTTGAQPATGGQTASLRVVSHYSCRNRNAASTGRLSEHSFGKAIDIAGIGLKNGREITVLTQTYNQLICLVRYSRLQRAQNSALTSAQIWPMARRLILSCALNKTCSPLAQQPS